MLCPSGSQPFLGSGTDNISADFPRTGLPLHSTDDSTHYMLLEQPNAFIYNTKKNVKLCDNKVEMSSYSENIPN